MTVLKLIMKIVIAPVILLLTLAIWICVGLVYVSGLVLGLLSTVIALLGVAGGIVSDFRISAFGFGRVLFLLGGLVLTAAGLFMFLLRKNLLMEETAAE